MKKQIILLGIVVLILLGCTACKSTSYLEKQSDLSSEDTSEDTTDSADTTEETEKKTEIYVQISGAVADPGVYTFPADSRVYELIEAAGGLLPEAYDVSIPKRKRQRGWHRQRKVLRHRMARSTSIRLPRRN